jgi:hypothetical protein
MFQIPNCVGPIEKSHGQRPPTLLAKKIVKLTLITAI